MACRTSPEISSRERSARTGFQILLKRLCAVRIGELTLFHGLPLAVCFDRPALCAATRAATSDVIPV